MSNNTCQWPDCDRTDILARGLCTRDYKRARRAGTLDQFTVTVRVCDICANEFVAGKHGRRFCSEQCRTIEYHAKLETLRARRIRDKAGRSCSYCGSAMPAEARSDADHCSVTCQQAQWYEDESDRLTEAANNWRLSNSEKRAEYARRREAQIASTQTGRIDRDRFIADSDGICGICGREINKTIQYPDKMSASTDHIVPLARGGAHTRSNLQVTHLRCNLKKGQRPLEKVVIPE